MFTFKNLKVSAVFIAFNVALLCLLVQTIKSYSPLLYFCMWLLATLESINIIFIIFQWAVAKNITVSRETKEKCIAGQTINVTINIKNKGAFPLFNIYTEDLTEDISDEKSKTTFLEYLPKKSSHKFIYELYCRKRGKYYLGPVNIYFFDILGMISFKRQYPVYSTLYVYPKTFGISRFPPLKKGNLPWFGVETRRTSGDEDEFFGLREYRQGDPIKKIHWFSTAKKGKLIVKEFQKISFYRASILFTLNKEENIGTAEESVGEYIINIASSLAKYLIEKDVSLELMAHAEQLYHFPSNKGAQYLEELMEFFASTKIESRLKITHVIQQFALSATPNSTLIIITTEKNLEMISRFLYAERYNISIILIVILSFSFDYQIALDKKDIRIKNEWSNIFLNAGLKPFFVYRKDNLENIFSE
jgi:uncharacterized protein (DUF58 family)